VIALAAACSPALSPAGNPDPRPTLILVRGAGGEAEFEQAFVAQAGRWREAAAQGSLKLVEIGADEVSEKPDEGKSEQPPAAPTDRARLEQTIAAERGATSAELWLVLLGHGTFDGRTARFNLRGPDVSPEELAGWLAGVERPLAIVNCASASGPFLPVLSGPNRVVITATRSGAEHNYARFGDHLSRAMADPSADLDKDGQTSLLEAFLVASRGVADFYGQANRLATEHPLVDDNGDRLGTPPEWFRGVRATKAPAQGQQVDGRRAHQWRLVPSTLDQHLPPELRKERDDLELAIFALRDRQAELPEAAFFRQLEILALKMADIDERAEASVQAASAPPSASTGSPAEEPSAAAN
jgi:hypothetical protein